MISTANLTLRFGERILFEDASIKFTPGNCYGLIGANGAGKSTFIKILNGEIQPTSGQVVVAGGQRIATLKQNHFEFDAYSALNTVIMGHTRLHQVIEEREAIYSKTDMTEDDGLKAAELEGEYAELGGWEAEADAASLLKGLGITEAQHSKLMSDLNGDEKVKVLLAQTLFGKPDILLLDEPTNHLDIAAVRWLEEFLLHFDKTVVVVSHDRHFLNKVCTHIADIDFGKIQVYVGNYDFWYRSSQLALKLMQEQNKRTEDKAKELENFIARFSANASKSRQATSRQKQLAKLTLNDIRPSNRKYPYVNFKPEREAGNNLLDINGLSFAKDGEQLFSNVTLTLSKGDKVAFVSENENALSAFYEILTGGESATAGKYTWGVTTSQAYFPKDNKKFFDQQPVTLVDWLRPYSPDQSENFIRGFLGRMLFSGTEATKTSNVLSGGERVRCMLAKMMLSSANVLVLDGPTNHLDLESITAVNEGLAQFKGTVLFSSHDHEFINTIANRIIEIGPEGVLFDKQCSYDEYLDAKFGKVSVD